MKLHFKFIVILCLLVYFSSYGQSRHSENGKKGSSQDNLFMHKKLGIGGIPNISEDNLQSLYSEIEKRRDLTLSQIDDPFTSILNYDEKLGLNRRKVLVYHQQSKLIAIVNRVYGPEDKIIAYKVFYFEKSNHCDWYTIRETDDLKSSTYTYLNGPVVKSDDTLTPLMIEESQKQWISKSAKLSLDSLMRHFPEFKYSLNWK